MALGNEEIKEVNEYKYLGFWINGQATGHNHINHLEEKAMGLHNLARGAKFWRGYEDNQARITIGLASDDVKLVLNNNSVPGYGHTHVHKHWKTLCRTQDLLCERSLLPRALLRATVDHRDFF